MTEEEKIKRNEAKAAKKAEREQKKAARLLKIKEEREAKKAKREAKKAARLKKLEEEKIERAKKKAAKKAEIAAKKQLRLEKEQQKREAKKAKREAKKAARLAKIEKEKAKKAAIREKKRLEREKKLAKFAKEKSKKQKNAKLSKKEAKATEKVKPTKEPIDIREAAKNMKLALAQVADEVAALPAEKRIKKAKSVLGLGYAVETTGTEVIVRFDVSKSKKLKVIKKEEAEEAPAIKTEKLAVASAEIVDDEPKEPEMIPAGDIYGSDGEIPAEVANLGDDDEIPTSEDEMDEDSLRDDFVVDPRDETDEDLIDSRKEFFDQFGDENS